MLPLPLALSALPLCRIVAHIVAAKAPLWRCAWSSLVPQHSLVRETYEKPLRRGLSNLRGITHVAVIATIKPGKSQAKNLRTASPLTSLITAALSPSRRARLTIFKSSRVLSFYGVGCQIRRKAGHGAAHSLAT